ncbi:MAG: adenosylhomocysteinase [candidate division WOR-3 bacterium]
MRDFHIADPRLAEAGQKRIEWAGEHMPVLANLSKEHTGTLKGLRLSLCLHVTTETANLVLALRAAGADTRLCASNPLSTQDDVAAALAVNHGVPVFAIHGEDKETYYEHIKRCLSHRPHITMDDGGDLTSYIHKEDPGMAECVLGGTEETTTGVIRFRAMEREGVLLYPIIAVNDSRTKFLFDNRYGTGQSTIDGILRLTNILLAGKTFAVAGYGWCGKGIAQRAKGSGARVLVCEADPIKALEAAMDGFEAVSVAEAIARADILVTATGDKHVVDEEHIALAKDGIILANSGHFDVEINIPAIRKASVKEDEARPGVRRFTLRDGRRIYLLTDGRLVNLSGAEGHPAEVMDMSFSNQFLAAKYLKENAGKLEKKVYTLPVEIDEMIARAKLRHMGMGLEELRPDQLKYLSDWREGT